MSMILLAIGSFLATFFLIAMFVGQKYDNLLEPLDSGEYPLKSIYSVGLTLQRLKPFSLDGRIGDKLRTDAMLCYSKQYSEYYARIAWSQALSFAMFSLAVFLVLGGLIPQMQVFFALLAAVMCGVSCYYFYSNLNNIVNERKSACEKEFPNAISKLALIVNSGVILHDAWEMVATGKEGVLYDLMRKTCEDMQNGKSEIDAIHDFGVVTNSDDIKKFASALIQSIERGGGELQYFLVNQSSELWAQRRQKTLQKGEKAASSLIMPIALMFFGVMLIVISAAMTSFSI